MTTSVLLILAAGCTFVTQTDLDNALQGLDDDGDGFTRDGGDCDDADPDVNPDAEEIWYDGLDSDCAGDDDNDADGDGEAADGSGEGTDCDDDDPDVYTGADDEWYDGIDSDCAGDDDFDADGDGYRSPEAEGGDDCDDADATVNPGATDVWYDGIDADCGGNDDYDADEDGYVYDEYVGLETVYVEGSGQGRAFDCDDSDESIYFGAPDTWYDGIDSDCSEDDDYDADLDGYRALESGDPVTDCDDFDPNRYPGNPEDLTDSTDHDCDGGPTSFEAETARETFNAATTMVATQHADTLHFHVAATQAVAADGTVYYDEPVAVTVDGDDPRDGSQGFLTWFSGNTFDNSFVDIGDGLDVVVSGDTLYGANVQFESGTQRKLQLTGYDLISGDRVSTGYPLASTDQVDAVALGIAQDGALHVIGCDSTAEQLQVMVTTPADLASSSFSPTTITDTAAGPCDLHFNADGVGTLTYADAVSGDYVTVQYPDDERPPATFTEVDRDTQWTVGDVTVNAEQVTPIEVLADMGASAVIVIEGNQYRDIPTTARPATLSQDAQDGVTYLAWTEDDGSVHVAWGSVVSGFDTGSMSLDFPASEVSTQVTSDGLWWVVAAHNGTDFALGVVPVPGSDHGGDDTGLPVDTGDTGGGPGGDGGGPGDDTGGPGGGPGGDGGGPGDDTGGPGGGPGGDGGGPGGGGPGGGGPGGPGDDTAAP